MHDTEVRTAVDTAKHTGSYVLGTAVVFAC